MLSFLPKIIPAKAPLLQNIKECFSSLIRIQNTVNAAAKEVLGKVATVVNNKPDLEFMVEGHTDNLPIDQEKAAETIPGVVDNGIFAANKPQIILVPK